MSGEILRSIFHYLNEITFILCLVIPGVIFLFYKRNSSLLNYIPAFCASIGIFMTFSVLWYTFQTDLKKLNKPEDMAVIIQLLSNKFSASLIGIFFSIIWNLIIKIRQGKIEARIRQEEWGDKDPQEVLWGLAISQKNTEATTNKVLESIASLENEFKASITSLENKVKASIDKQTKEQQKLTGHIEQIGSFIQERFEETLKDLSYLLKQHVGQMGTDALKESKESVKVIHEEFAKQTETLMENHRSALSESLGGITGTLKDTSDLISKSLNTVSANITDSTQTVLNQNLEQIRKAFDSLNEFQERSKTYLEETITKFTEAVQAYKDVQSNHKQVLKALEDQVKQVGQLQEGAQNLLDQWKSQTGEIAEVRKGIAQIANTAEQLQVMNGHFAAFQKP